MIGHLGISVTDLEIARTYYGRILPPLGFDLFIDHDDEFAYRPANGKPGTFVFFYPASGSGERAFDDGRAGLQHLAFMVSTRAEVDAMAALVTELGSLIVHPPQEWPQYPPPYYATFWKDPDGMTVEAVCHRDA